MQAGLKAWVTPPVQVSGASFGEVVESKKIGAIRQAARDIKGGAEPKDVYGEMAKSFLDAAEPTKGLVQRGTSTAYFDTWDEAKYKKTGQGWSTPEEILKKFPKGEDVDLTLYSFSNNRSHAEDFAAYAVDRKGGYPLMISLIQGAKAVDVEKAGRLVFPLGDRTREVTADEGEFITTGKAKVHWARYNPDKKSFSIILIPND